MLRTSLALALAALPFELAAGFAAGPITLTNVELLLLLPLGLWALVLGVEQRWPDLPRWLLVGSALVVGLLLLSAALATEQRLGALKFALRQAQGAAFALCLADTLRQMGGARLFAGALLGGAGVSAALGLLELSEAPRVMAALAPFKTESTYMGGLLRLSATFSYANTAAQYFEALLPLSVLVAIGGWAGRSLLARAARFVLPPLLLLATLLTYSRAALLTTSALLVLTPLVAWRALGPRAGRYAGLAGAGLAALGLGLAVASPTFRLRVTEPDVARWYGAIYQPSPVAPMAPNERRAVPIALTNNGRLTWQHTGLRPVRLAYHWLDAETGAVVRFEGVRTELPHPVAPGATVTLTATVQAPDRPGRYVLAWDLLREYIGRGWFSQMGVAPARLTVEVGGSPAPGVAPPPAEPASTPRVIAPQPGPPGRRELWLVALELWSERPLLGIGPDVFRHVYGPRLGLQVFDARVHTNNLYLELLTGAGVAGLLAFLGMVGAGFWMGLQALPRGALANDVLAGALLGVAAFMLHGALDVFLAFTPTYGLFWTLLGMLGGAGAGGPDVDSGGGRSTNSWKHARSG